MLHRFKLGIGSLGCCNAKTSLVCQPYDYRIFGLKPAMWSTLRPLRLHLQLRAASNPRIIARVDAFIGQLIFSVNTMSDSVGK